MYNPKPAKYEEGNAFLLTRYDSWDIGSNLRAIISDVSKCLLYQLTDTPYENKYLHGCGMAEMKEDPYLVWHRISGMDYSFKAPELASLKDLIVNRGRAAGLWTLHGKSGNNLGVVGNDFLIRINPDAWPAVLGMLSRGKYGLDLISVSRPSPENPGWRRVPWYNVKEDTSIELYKLLKQGTIQVKKGNEDYFLMKDVSQGKDAQVRDHMEHLISKYDLMKLSGTDPEGWLVKAMFPNVPPELVVKNYMTYAIQESYERELKDREDKLAKEIKEVRELRKVSRSFHKIGGWDGLLTAMGKDIHDSLTLNAADWARGINDDEESRFTMRKLSEALTKMARDYLEGTVEFPEDEQH
jgi:hypothetical protein